MLSDRLRRLARAIGYIHRHCSGGLDKQTALALVSAQARHLTLASVARNIDDPHVVFVAVNESTPILDDHPRAAWRRDAKSPALRRCWMNCSPSRTRRRVRETHNSVVILECNVLIARLDPRCRRVSHRAYRLVPTRLNFIWVANPAARYGPRRLGDMHGRRGGGAHTLAA